MAKSQLTQCYEARLMRIDNPDVTPDRMGNQSQGGLRESHRDLRRGQSAASVNCKHCGRAIADGDLLRGWIHADDQGRNSKSRCDPDESGLAYGYNAEPPHQPCRYPCLGCGKGLPRGIVPFIS